MPSLSIIVGGRSAEMIMGVRLTALQLALLRLGIAGDTPGALGNRGCSLFNSGRNQAIVRAKQVGGARERRESVRMTTGPPGGWVLPIEQTREENDAPVPCG